MLESQINNVNTSANQSVNEVGEQLQKLIAVTKPYFALQNIVLGTDDSITCDLPVQFYDHNEISGISLSEAGRHMAILGTLAVANQNPRKEKHYYLATDAIIDRVHTDVINSKGCKATAKIVSMDRKQGVVKVQMYSSDNRLTYKAELRYAILHHKIFERLFSAKKTLTDISLHNPYALKTPIRIGEMKKDYHTAFIDKINKADCAGHFDNFPALPVARICGAMFELSGIHFNNLRFSDEKYCIRRVEMHADSFVFADEKVQISTIVKPDYPERGQLIEAHVKASKECNAVETKCWFC